MRPLLLVPLVTLSGHSLCAEPETLDLTGSDNGVKIIRSYSGEPDSQGILETFTLRIPAFNRGVYYCGYWWPYAGNRVRPIAITQPEGPEGGIFLLLDLADGRYLAILPLCGEQAYAWFAPGDGCFKLHLGTHGSSSVNGDMPLAAWAFADSPYDACRQAWSLACEVDQIKGWMKRREDKKYPEVFNYLGWCSWESYHKEISSDGMVSEFKGLEQSPVPIRYFLVDDGHFDPDSLAPKQDTFPHGYKPLVDLRRNDGIRWVGMWHALLGDAWAMPEGQPAEIADAMMLAHNGRMVPKPDEASIETFLRHLLSASIRDGIDIVKIDFCGTLLPIYAGTGQRKPLGPFPPTTANAVGNPTEATVLFSRLYQAIVAEEFDGLINCNWHVPHFIFNSGENSVGRCSEDYIAGNLTRAKEHLYHSYASTPWLGQTAWGDHDMFHSSDKVAGRMMAVSKAMSGAPIYLSDRHSQLKPEHIFPLCYGDGLLLRPLAPAAPLPEDVFRMLEEERLYRVMAPLPNKSAAFVLYNLHRDLEGGEPELSGSIGPGDYAAASAMIQPYPGRWAIPDEGLLVYDHYTQKASKMGEGGYKVIIKGFGDRLLQVSPIQHGWSVIGRTDKFLSSAAVEVLAVDDDRLTLRLREAGPFAIWLSTGRPKAEALTFVSQDDHLYVSTIPIASGPRTITIEKE